MLNTAISLYLHTITSHSACWATMVEMGELVSALDSASQLNFVHGAFRQVPFLRAAWFPTTTTTYLPAYHYHLLHHLHRHCLGSTTTWFALRSFNAVIRAGSSRWRDRSSFHNACDMVLDSCLHRALTMLSSPYNSAGKHPGFCLPAAYLPTPTTAFACLPPTYPGHHSLDITTCGIAARSAITVWLLWHAAFCGLPFRTCTLHNARAPPAL